MTNNILVLKTLVIYLCFSLVRQVLTADKDVFVHRHETIVLNCTCFYQNESTWRVKTSKVAPVDTTVTEKLFIPYTQGLLLNPKLMNSNIDVTGNYTSGECDLIIRNFSNDDVGIYICEYWENGNIYIDTYVVNIQNPPVIKINHTITEQEIILVCNPTGGEPKNYTFGLWEHHSEFKEFIRSLKGTNAGTLTILKSNSSNRLHENDGIYTCTATNGIVGANGSLLQKGYILINEKVPPIFLNSNNAVQYGRSGQMKDFTLILYNKFGTIQIYILHQHEYLQVLARQERILTHDLVYNVNITVHGIKITFKQILDTYDELKNYSIKACNQEGCNEFIVQVIMSKDDLKSAYENGYCWILMGSIVGGTLIFCIGSQIFCWVKRAKTFNAVLQIPQENNYDEIETLNYNNAIFDQISNVAEMNNESVSSIIETNDIIPRADIDSSDDSSSTKQFGDGYENPYQAINPCEIEKHQYSSIINDNYQNTMIFSSESVTNIQKNFHIAMNSFRQPSSWLVIYMKKQ